MNACWLVSLIVFAPSDTVRLEAEDARLEGPSVTSSRAGHSGRGYVTDFTKDKARVVWTHRAKAGIYLARVGFSTPGGTKGFELGVNGSRFAGQFPDIGERWGVFDAGKIELKEGVNEISVERGWGYYDLDYVELTPAPPVAPLKPVPDRLSNPNSTPATRRVFRTLLNHYGKGTLSGQYEQREANFIRNQTGRYPAILGGDFMDYSPSRIPFGSKPKNLTESYVQAGRSGTLLTLSWHWNAPNGLLDREDKNERGETINRRWYRGFYTDATTFDVAKALANPQSEEYRLILRDIDAIAIELKKLADANVPVLWRPLHEAEGGWFWWGAKGPDPAKKLWRLMYDRLTHEHRLNNLIWVWNSAKEEWYPGDDVVDIMSIDVYPSDRSDPLSGPWEDLIRRFDGRKMLALAEFPGSPDIDRMWRFGVRWSYFVSWTGSLGPKSDDPAKLKRIYNSSRVFTEDELKPPKR